MSDDPGRPPLGPHGGPRSRGVRDPETLPTGVRRDYILRRLERDGRHELAAAIRDGHVSAYAIAVELGWTQRAEPTGVGSTNATKRRQHRLRELSGLLGDASDELSPAEAMELWLGPNPAVGSYFDSREELEQAWKTYREEIMARWGSHGRRPAAFYEFEWDGDRPPYDQERSALWRAGVLTEQEKVELEAGWWAALDAVKGKSAQERRGAYAQHDIPRELIKVWTAERRRRSKTVCNPPAEASAEVSNVTR
jgi:hypothetical protein